MRALRAAVVLVLALALSAPVLAQESQLRGAKLIPLEDMEIIPDPTYTVRCYQGGVKIIDRRGLIADSRAGLWTTKDGKPVVITEGRDTTCIAEQDN